MAYIKFFTCVFVLLTISNVIPNVLTDIAADVNAFRACIEEAGLPSDTTVTSSSNATLYKSANHQMNLRNPPGNPPVIILPRSIKDVQIAVKCGTKNNIHMVVRSGGHSSEAISSGAPEVAVLDFNRMHEINIDPKEKTALIEPGNPLGKVYWTLWNEGGFGLPLGTCYTVGVGGYTLGGGVGFYSSLYGYGLDRLKELTFVDANGEAHTVNKDENKDLFWGLRGMGSGYLGIVASFKFNLFQASDLRLTFVSFTYDLNRATDVILAYQNWCVWARKNEPSVVSFIAIAEGKLMVSINQPLEKDSPRTNKIFLEKIAVSFPADGNMQVDDPIVFIDLVQKVGHRNLIGGYQATLQDLPTLTNHENEQVYQKTKSFYVNGQHKRSELQKVSDVLQRMPSKHMELTLLAVFGAAAAPSPTATAYVSRKPLYYFSYEYTNPENDEGGRASALAWMDEFTAATEFMNNGRTYANDVDYDMKDQLERYYGENLPRLIQIKAKWDPLNYFYNPASIPVLIRK